MIYNTNMKVYKFVFIVGSINLLLPFVGIPTVYKQYAYITLGAIAIAYALIVRTIIKEKESGLTKEVIHKESVVHTSETSQSAHVTRKIEEVVDMEEKAKKIQRPIVRAKRPAIRAVSHTRQEDN